MKASIGDWIVVQPQPLGGVRREGQIVGMAHGDGSPPWRVRWTDTDQETLVFPGPDARVLSEPPHAGG